DLNFRLLSGRDDLRVFGTCGRVDQSKCPSLRRLACQFRGPQDGCRFRARHVIAGCRSLRRATDTSRIEVSRRHHTATDTAESSKVAEDLRAFNEERAAFLKERLECAQV